MEFPHGDIPAAYTDNAEDAKLLHREIFEHSDWISKDRGASPREAYESMCTHIPERLHESARKITDHWYEWLRPKEDMNFLAREIKEMGYGLYILSNIPQEFVLFRDAIPAYACADGCVLSFEEKVLKPDLEIYRRLFTKFALIPCECFFIDDKAINVEAARFSSMEAERYTGDLSSLRKTLRSAGVSVSES